MSAYNSRCEADDSDGSMPGLEYPDSVPGSHSDPADECPHEDVVKEKGTDCRVRNESPVLDIPIRRGLVDLTVSSQGISLRVQTKPKTSGKNFHTISLQYQEAEEDPVLRLQEWLEGANVKDVEATGEAREILRKVEDENL
ncbi:hypothetical protein C8R43DRAFT_1127301 [Mycena crocata]|nr:hypothetical protein C8R43DRAFT_1127301 [Mycena crocata]